MQKNPLNDLNEDLKNRFTESAAKQTLLSPEKREEIVNRNFKATVEFDKILLNMYVEDSSDPQSIKHAQDRVPVFLEAVLTKGADIDKQDKNGKTLLHIAAESGNDTIIGILLDEGADIHVKDESGLTAANLAELNDHNDIYNFLAKKEALEKAENKPLEKYFTDYFTKQDKGFYNTRPLSSEIIKKMADNNSKSVVHFDRHLSATYGKNRVPVYLKEVLTKGDDVDKQGENGKTLLHIAAESGKDIIISILVNRGANIYAKDKNGKTAADLAKLKNYSEICNYLDTENEIRLLSDRCSGPLSLINAIEGGKFKTAEALLYKEKFDVNTKDENGQTALHVAAKSGNMKGVIFLSSRGDIKIEEKDNKGRTAADLAKSNNHHKICNFLDRENKIRSGLDHSGLLSLINAIEVDKFQMAKTLLNGGVDVNTKDENGQTALHAVSESGNQKGVTFLLTRKGIKIEEKDNGGKTAADLAESNNHTDTYNLLVKEQKRRLAEQERRLAEQERMSNSSDSVTANSSGSVTANTSVSVVEDTPNTLVTNTQNSEQLSGNSKLSQGSIT